MSAVSKILFTSDFHFGHKNAINFDNRPYFTVSEMDKVDFKEEL